jgi:putative flippase GtrA
VSRGIRFIGVGLFSTLIYFAVSGSLMEFFRTDPKAANVAAYLVGMGVSYLGHRHVTFNSRGAVRSEILRFAATHSANLILSTLLIYGLVDRLGVNRFAGVAFATLFVMASSFIIMQLWVFRSRAAPRLTL